ncbi:MAG: CD1871A family CXXC motif-containing protein [Clostridia bacterium]
MKQYATKHVAIALLIIAVCLIGVGILCGDYDSVLNKAVYICLECIGIG